MTGRPQLRGEACTFAGWWPAGHSPARSARSRGAPGCLFTASPPSERSRAVFDWTWVFVLRPVAEGCRLIARVRGELSPSWLAVVVRPLLEPTHLVMERKMLLGLKRRAEQAATTVRRRPFSISHPKAGRTGKGSQDDLVKFPT
jgi:hypothetical protein